MTMNKEQADKTRDLLVKHWFPREYRVDVAVCEDNDSDHEPNTEFVVTLSALFSYVEDKVSLTVTQAVLTPSGGHNVYMSWQALIAAYKVGYDSGKKRAFEQMHSAIARAITDR